jgi:nitrite reductase/ring-hydroxylating ferredoxin subunit
MTMKWVEIGSIDDIPVRGARCVNTPEGRIAVFRTAEGEVFAIEDHCPHNGGDLPAAQLGDLARDRQGAGRRRGRGPDRAGEDRGPAPVHRAG